MYKRQVKYTFVDYNVSSVETKELLGRVRRVEPICLSQVRRCAIGLSHQMEYSSPDVYQANGYIRKTEKLRSQNIQSSNILKLCIINYCLV